MAKRINKQIEININDYFDIDVTLGIEEIIEFFKECTDEEKLKLRSALKLTSYSTYGENIIDTMKIELLKEAREKYTLDELEKRLK